MTVPLRLDLRRRRLRRTSRQFASVGVRLAPARLAEIAAGCPATEDELFDVAFAQAARRVRADQRRARRARAKRTCLHSVIVLGGVVLALTAVVCLGLGFFLMAAHQSPL